MENVPATKTNTFAANSPLAVMQNNISRQPVTKQIMFLLAIAASIAVGGYVFMWSQTPSYQVLFSGMEAQESSEVANVLQQMKIDYKLDPTSGALLVPASEVQGLRLRLAAEGLPRSSAQGMEILSQEQGFGTSQFIEQARYQRAMEQELARSVAELQNVRSARVHLAIPKQSVFVRERKPPTASVVLNMYAGRTLERGHIAAITHMVAASVPNMKSSDVTVVDQRGNLLSQPERNSSMALSDTQLEFTQKLEQLYISRIEDILTPIVGMNGVRAQVVADVDFTVTEQTQESYNPDLAALRSEQLAEEERVGGLGPMGVPGALTNQPPGGGVAPEQAVQENVGEDGEVVTNTVTPGSSTKRSTRNFELDRTISHSRLAPGSIRKLSVAVLVDEPATTDAEGNMVSTPLNDAQMARINTLVMDAIGFNMARGDSLNVVSAPFVTPVEAEPLPSIPLWEQPWFWEVGKQVLGALVVLFLIFGLIRPAFRDLNKSPDKQLANQTGENAEGMSAEQVLAASSKNGEDIAKLTTGSERVEQHLTNIRSLVQQDPALVAQVVKNWAASDA
ncbi:MULTISPECIES: flagellar basal-body MS-ring/collar protein FliF [unclassified Methylophaga]|jgi:flagellar M-ring protein FliF|uniref:flagellar basal-body MS-ring/collar protein FliF n=1 Tax=unclassified Methylophaga TaxID=2629249 RepID=UPI000C8B857A|nr:MULTISPECIES: flagellar basal-body MS-ring/collar protein FliF [unclassified Methylophaga]MAK67436.1 flagellar M-ring protein FliF [Methylophaga sp.]MAY16976.1 flagellar M-ring protein FliF [Methylophaga sp.]MBN46506.1 flagellar M-ring protein FliF [Methylophaga sp.]|tara:strand:- start:28853 stop:30544 length:1692 start_codon:yes stop_codon:yes gene_type:complete